MGSSERRRPVPPRNPAPDQRHASSDPQSTERIGRHWESAGRERWWRREFPDQDPLDLARAAASVDRLFSGLTDCSCHICRSWRRRRARWSA
jgi:hypothetical protein